MIRGKNVLGVLPHSLSYLTNTFSELQLELPKEKRGIELNIEDVKRYSRTIKTYKITKILDEE